MLWNSIGGKDVKSLMKCGSFLSYACHVVSVFVPSWDNACFILGNGSHEPRLFRRPYDKSDYGRVVGRWVVCPRDDEH